MSQGRMRWADPEIDSLPIVTLVVLLCYKDVLSEIARSTTP